jgi:capsular polysaccharide biosynthesis protein
MEQTKILDKYEYFESDKEFYYNSYLNIIFDKDKNMVMNSNINFMSPNFVESSKKSISNLDLSIDYPLYTNMIFIQHWHPTYGHFKDELFNLYNFYKLLNQNHFRVGMKYANFYNNNSSVDNYTRLSSLLFEPDTFINIHSLNTVKLKNIIVIKHTINCPMFHMFPQLSINKILTTIDNNNNYNKNIFITRGKAGHLPRNLDNQQELEQHFLNINYNVINPELIDIKLFIQQIKNAETIYITWGGAMVNLCYVNPNATIYLLQSLSYNDEDIFFIFKFLKKYNNLYVIKCNNNNKIDLPFQMVKLSCN